MLRPWMTQLTALPVFDLRPPITDVSAPDLVAAQRQNISALIRAAWRFADDADQIPSSVRALHRNKFHSHGCELSLVPGLLGDAFQARAYGGP